ncbi:PR-1-like protein [Penicillium frequentans]|uniref:PR-1-like protein n=1 Tax=Penicillium frequentans TaxID=3151616 RepID=A0AAD6GFG5_9EURO|nr:PR-1-like protein [Penicillium glabrum]
MHLLTFFCMALSLSCLTGIVIAQQDCGTAYVTVTKSVYETSEASTLHVGPTDTPKAPEHFHGKGHRGGHGHRSSKGPSSVSNHSAIAIQTPTIQIASSPSFTSSGAGAASSPSTLAASSKTVSSSTSTSATSSSIPTFPSSGTYEEKALYSHNIHRLNHTVPNMSWNQTLADAATSWADQCDFAHNTTMLAGGYGQNLAASSPTASISVHISDYWYNGEMPLYAGLYGEAEPSGTGFGHFTQVVWKDSTSVGCGTVDCTSSSLGMWYTVCNYWPAGNWVGEYDSNVLKPIGNPIVKGDKSDIMT